MLLSVSLCKMLLESVCIGPLNVADLQPSFPVPLGIMILHSVCTGYCHTGCLTRMPVDTLIGLAL